MNDHDLIQQIQALKAIKPSSDWALLTRANLIRIVDSDTKLSAQGTRQLAETKGYHFFALLRSVTAFALTAFVLAAVGSAVVNESLPGQTLYSVKIALEGAQTALTPGDNLNLKATFTERRVEEASQLASSNLAGEEADTLAEKLADYRKEIEAVRATEDTDKLRQKIAVIEEQTRVLTVAISHSNGATFEENLRTTIAEKLRACSDEELVEHVGELLESGIISDLIEANELSVRCSE